MKVFKTRPVFFCTNCVQHHQPEMLLANYTRLNCEDLSMARRTGRGKWWDVGSELLWNNRQTTNIIPDTDESVITALHVDITHLSL